MMFISVFLMKLADCALSTMKTVFLCKNRFFISSVLNSIAAVLFILVAESMTVAPEDKKVYIKLCIFFLYWKKLKYLVYYLWKKGYYDIFW